MIGTFTGAASRPHPELVRFPFIDASNAPDDETEDEAYADWTFWRSFDSYMIARSHEPLPFGRKRAIPPID